QAGEPGQFGVDLVEVAAEQVLGGLTGADTGVPYRQKGLDLGEPQAEPLRATDEAQSLDGLRRVPPVCPRGPRRCRYQAGPLVVPQGVPADAGIRRDLGNGESDPHGPTVEPGAPSRFNVTHATIGIRNVFASRAVMHV